MTGERLRIVGGAMQGQEIPLDNDFTVGRGEQGSGSLAGDTEISRQHARFRRLDSGQVMVEDLGSTNGTLVNGTRIGGPYVLSPGDRVTVGKTTLELVADEQATAVGTAGAAGVGNFGPLPAIGQPAPGPAPAGRSATGAGRSPLVLVLAGLVLVAAGLAAGLLINKDDGKPSATAASSSGGGGSTPSTSGGK